VLLCYLLACIALVSVFILLRIALTVGRIVSKLYSGTCIHYSTVHSKLPLGAYW